MVGRVCMMREETNNREEENEKSERKRERVRERNNEQYAHLVRWVVWSL